MRLIFAMTFVLLSACAQTQAPVVADAISYGVQSGLQPDDAVIIIGAKDQAALERGKANWLATHFAGWMIGESTMQSLAGLGDDGPTYYHAVTLHKGSAVQMVYFDVNEFVHAMAPGI
jgi:hypothetical protein